MMKSNAINVLFQKSLGIREDGKCNRHPEVPILDHSKTTIGICDMCAMEAAHREQQHNQQNGKEDAYATMSNSFWSSAGTLSLASGPAHVQNRLNNSMNFNSHRNDSSAPKPPQYEHQFRQSPSEDNSERQQQQQLLDSILARWCQLQDISIQQSIACRCHLQTVNPFRISSPAC